jgi:hypothetical protein
VPDTDKLSAALDEIRERVRAAALGPWTVRQADGLDIAGDGWSQQSVHDADGADVATTYYTGIFEHELADENAAFITAARSDVPRLLALADAVLGLCGDWDDRTYVVAPEDVAEDFRSVISRALLGGNDG